jgi:hypothetical protein
MRTGSLDRIPAKRINKGLNISGEFEWMKRSFDGIHVSYLVPIKKNALED